MRRLALLIPVALAGSLALASCSGGSPAGHAAGTSATSTAGQAAGRSATAAPTWQPTRTGDEKTTKAESPATVVDGMHYVQLFNSVDPVLAQMAQDAVGGKVPPSTQLQNAASSLRQFAAQARRLPSSGDDRQTLDQLASASSTLAGQLTTLAANRSTSSDSSDLSSALGKFQSAAAVARHAAGLPAVVTSKTPQADTGP
jgi:hypothetical protein